MFWRLTAAYLRLLRHGGGQRLIALTNIASDDVTVDVGDAGRRPYPRSYFPSGFLHPAL